MCSEQSDDVIRRFYDGPLAVGRCVGDLAEELSVKRSRRRSTIVGHSMNDEDTVILPRPRRSMVVIMHVRDDFDE